MATIMQSAVARSTKQTESSWDEPTVELTVAQKEEAYDRFVAATLQRSGYVLAALYLLFIVLHWLLLEPPARWVMTALALISSLLIGAVTSQIRRPSAPLAWSHPLAAIVMTCVIANSLVHLYLSQEPWQTTNLILAVLGAGFFFLSRRWYIGSLLLIQLGWWSIYFTSPSTNALPNDLSLTTLWPHYSTALISASVLSVMVHLTLGYLVQRTAALRIRDEEQKSALKVALDSVQESEERLRHDSKQVEANLRQIHVLYRVNQAILTSSSLPEVLQRIADSVATALPAYIVAIHIIDMQKKEVNQIVRGGSQERAMRWESYDELMSGLTGWSIRKMKPAISAKGLVDPRESERARQVRNESAIGAVVVAPIVYRNEALGTLTAMNRIDQDDFSEQDIETMQAMAGQVAIAIVNTRLIDELRQRGIELAHSNELLEARVAERTREITATNQQLQEQLQHRTQIEDELRRSEEDLSHRVELRTAELSTVNAELSRAARLKDEFLANMSHELRTPLHAILGLSEALQEEVYGPLNERQQKTLTSVIESSRLLLSLINDILEISKIEAGRLELELNWVPIPAVTRICLELVKQTAQKKRIQVNFRQDMQVTSIRADERRLKQILVNLMTNAVKFTPDGGHVGLEVVGDADAQVVKFTVWDTGIGIEEDDLNRLFQPFVQLDSSLSRQHPGTGLGLALVYRMTKLHGGSITVQSEPGRGSRFTVALPWIESVQNASANLATAKNGKSNVHLGSTKPDPNRKQALVLLADDNEITLEAFTDYLTSSGYRVVAVRNGVDAVKSTIELLPSAVLMDINMPQMDGVEAVRRIRAESSTANIPVIVITAMAMPGDREKCLAVGATEYLSKPVSLRTVLTSIEQHLHVNDFHVNDLHVNDLQMHGLETEREAEKENL